MRRWRSVVTGALFLAVVAGAGAAVSRLEDAQPGGGQSAGVAASAWQGLVGNDRPSVALGQRVIVVLKAPSLADRVRRAGGRASDSDERSWTAAALASQQQFLAEMADKGVIARPSLRFTRVLNGFSAVADPSAIALLERSPQVVGVYPVRAAFPALSSVEARTAASPVPIELSGFPGQGITVALLDTAVGPATPYLRDHILPGFDIVSGGVAARYDQRPGGKRLETHGTLMAGIVVGRSSTGRSAGVAPEATILPIRVAGWQRDASGRWSIHARTDQIVAGLERAVDPDRDGDAHDAARVTLLPLAEPFAAFEDGPLAEAVGGAAALDSLVVTAAGNDGPGGPAFGSISGPGGAPEALTVGALDLRPGVRRVPVLVRSGLTVLMRRPLETVTTAEPPIGTFEVALVEDPRDLFSENGRSRVAGRAAVLVGDGNLKAAATRAADAGAALVMAAGGALPAGALGLEPSLAVPILSARSSLVGPLKRELRSGQTVWLSTGRASDAASSAYGRVGSFTSWGLAFGGHLKPEVASSGVGVVSALPGRKPNGRSMFVTVSGTSAAAAIVAGTAARLAQARPALDAQGLRSAIVGTARPVKRGAALAQGTGTVDASRAASAELVVSPASISFGRAGGDGWHGRSTLTLTNVSTRDLTVYLDARGGGSRIVLELSRVRVKVPAGGSVRVRIGVRLVGVGRVPIAAGTIRLDPRDGTALDVPWTLVLASPPDDLIGDVELSEQLFSPSDLTPTVLAVRVGAIVEEGGRDAIEPAQRFDVLLQDEAGHVLGLLARLRDVLPGRYAFGITGRAPNGKPLKKGSYRLRLMAWPAAGGSAVVRTAAFTVR
jgi:subtilisin family serine protease